MAQGKGAAKVGLSTQERAEGRERVRVLFWQRLDDAGLLRPRGKSVEEFAQMRARVSERLAYMTGDNLMTLADIVIQNATGRGVPRVHCWSEAAIMTHAKGMQTPPPLEFPIVSSWLASVEGPPAIIGGYEVELYRHLSRTGMPPGPYDMSRIKAAGAEAARRHAITAERIARGTAMQSDRDELAAYQAHRQTVARIVAAGVARRQDKARADVQAVAE
ncbi:hypothetical protein AN189_18030 [Loktanella sp. 3ANDIMAR09]|uniref:hypothetical protein n=1 Tax=Loktanella sp. 3ANDIMAR09 TaxID=1225657 RepID=UPI0007082B2C|nr:hypothetical protein [Loktanella sp. 3ANDIMAR09]KQI66978.1 hypothetical protein AN189_18030 [Loktanella sp. 3ANDIMAR09]